MTQCILSHILSDHHRQLNKYYLESFYDDCLEKDQVLDEIEFVQKEKHLHRRYINQNGRKISFILTLYFLYVFKELRYSNPRKIHLDNIFGVPLFFQLHGQSRLSVVDENNNLLQQIQPKLISEESIMRKKSIFKNQEEFFIFRGTNQTFNINQ